MLIENNSKTESIAQIATEETRLNLAVGRVMLAVAAVAIFVSGLYTIFSNSSGLIEKDIVFGLALLIVSVFTAFGAWRAHVVHNKLKTQSSSENSDTRL